MNKMTFRIADKYVTVDEREEGFFVDDELHTVDIAKVTEHEYSILLRGKSYHLFFSTCNNCLYAQLDNHIFEIKRHSLRDQLMERFLKAASDHTTAVTFRAPMPGLVTKIMKKIDMRINEGEGALVVEAMKMENEIKSSKAGVISKIFVHEKQAVEKGDPLFTVE